MSSRYLLRRWIALASIAAGSQAGFAQDLWSYSYSGGSASGSGYITTTSTTSAGGGYSITGISGTRDGQPILQLLAAGTYAASGGGSLMSDNVLYPSAPNLDLGGFTVRVGGDLDNVYNTGGQSYDLAGAQCLASNCGQPGHLGTAINFSVSQVPELQWQFTYSGAGVSASGDLTTLATEVGGEYQIVGLSGTRNGVAMNALLPGGTYLTSGGGYLISDNELSPTAPYLDLDGFTFNAGTSLFNVYQSEGQYYDLAGADCLNTNCGQPGHMGTPISFSLVELPISQAPEIDPASASGALTLLVGALALVCGRRPRKLAIVSAQAA